MVADSKQHKPLVIGLGEILWDVFPDGPRFGGAPANFACSVAGLASGMVSAAMVSAVGRDALGNQALSELAQRDVDHAGVSQIDKATGRVLVTINGLGEASYEFESDAAWDHLTWSDALASMAAQADAVCFGTLGSRTAVSAETILRFVRSTLPRCLRVFDVNLRSPFWTESTIAALLPLASVIKCNEDELPVIAKLAELTGSDESVLRQLQQRFSLTLAVVTRGAAGSLVVDRQGIVSDLPAISTPVADTVGAGDSFTAATTLGLLHDLPLSSLHDWASRTAAFVCSQPGATPALPSTLQLPGILSNASGSCC